MPDDKDHFHVFPVSGNSLYIIQFKVLTYYCQNLR